MKTLKELQERIGLYKTYTFEKSYGFIVWQLTSGENFEILFISGEGHGVELMKEWVKYLKDNSILPFNSIMVIRQNANERAGIFYRKLGFDEIEIPNLYKEQVAILSTVNFDTLCRNLATL